MELRLPTGADDLQAAEVVAPTESMARGLALWQSSMDDTYFGGARLGRERDLEGAGERGAFRASRLGPTRSPAVEAVDLDVTSPHAAIIEEDGELASRAGLQDRAVTHPAYERVRTGEVFEHLLRAQAKVPRRLPFESRAHQFEIDTGDVPLLGTNQVFSAEQGCQGHSSTRRCSSPCSECQVGS